MTDASEPITSMTGFGSSSFQVEAGPAAGRRYRIDIKAVNHRYLNARLNMPPELASFAAEATRIVRERLVRGSIEVQISVEIEGEYSVEVHIDHRGAGAMMKELHELASAIGAPPPTLDVVLRYGDFVKLAAPRIDPAEYSDAFFDGLRAALDGVVAMRTREGEALGRDLRARLGALDLSLDRVAKDAPRVQEAYGARLRQRLEEVVRKTGAAVDEARLATELVLFADRSDVTEEAVRARTHVANFRAMLAGAAAGHEAGSLGKRLDFLAQELGREFNTLGSKCRDAELAGVVVNAKVELERIREQIQNIA